MRALRLEVGRLFKDAWDACFCRCAHVVFLVELVWQMAFRVVSRLDSRHEGTRGASRLRVEVFRMTGFRSLRFDLETHPQRAAATATATEEAGVVRGECHVV
jgi:hypothetical protein